MSDYLIDDSWTRNNLIDAFYEQRQRAKDKDLMRRMWQERCEQLTKPKPEVEIGWDDRKSLLEVWQKNGGDLAVGQDLEPIYRALIAVANWGASEQRRGEER